jgi:hypothetical protein
MFRSRLRERIVNLALAFSAAIFSLYFGPTKALAQVTGTITGYVTDQSKLAVADARVTVTMVQQDLTRSTQSDTEGFYDLVALPPGVYTIAVEKSGFERTVQSGIVVTVHQNVRADMILRVGAVTQSVTVSGQVPLVDTRSSTVSGLVDDRRIVDLPLNGRNVIGLAKMSVRTRAS